MIGNSLMIKLFGWSNCKKPSATSSGVRVDLFLCLRFIVTKRNENKMYEKDPYERETTIYSKRSHTQRNRLNYLILALILHVLLSHQVQSVKSMWFLQITCWSASTVWCNLKTINLKSLCSWNQIIQYQDYL